MKFWVLCAAIAAVFLPGSVAVAAEAETVDHAVVCMMQDTVMVKPGVPIVHDGKTYYGCCAMCADKLKKDPEKYTVATDLVSGRDVDKAGALIYDYHGRALYFESRENLLAFVRNPAAYLALTARTGH